MDQTITLLFGVVMTAVPVGWHFVMAVPSWLLEGHPAQDDAQLIAARQNGERFHVLSVTPCAPPVKASPRNLTRSIVRDGVPDHDLWPNHRGRLATDRLTRHDVGRLESLGHRVTLEAGTTIAWKPFGDFWGISVVTQFEI